MTPKQTAYVQHRAAGMTQARAAVAAGYAEQSAKVIASRMEKLPAIREAIAAARAAAKSNTPVDASPEFDDAESYLAAVVQGLTPPDPVRVGAARVLIQYQRQRQRSPLKNATPRQLASKGTAAREEELLDLWSVRAAAIRARLKRTA